MDKDIKYMKEAIKEAKKAYLKNEVPIGCVIVYNDKIIGRGHNERETKQLSLAHAEIIAIKKACKKIESWRLEDSTIYITLEPCSMCGGAIIQSRIKRVVYGAKDYRFGVHQSIMNLFDVPFNHKVSVTTSVLEDECSKLISDFFKELRENKLAK
ncbi:MAG: tRNA adenosine(34) deaminase TadA [Acholeplasmatales bacterium]|nr:tRNA adenosine(34) deaminase TadA [Acholeplasmatales bacterium]